jgi:hypothetical protein
VWKKKGSFQIYKLISIKHHKSTTFCYWNRYLFPSLYNTIFIFFGCTRHSYLKIESAQIYYWQSYFATFLFFNIFRTKRTLSRWRKTPRWDDFSKLRTVIDCTFLNSSSNCFTLCRKPLYPCRLIPATLLSGSVFCQKTYNLSEYGVYRGLKVNLWFGTLLL